MKFKNTIMLILMVFATVLPAMHPMQVEGNNDDQSDQVLIAFLNGLTEEEKNRALFFSDQLKTCRDAWGDQRVRLFLNDSHTKFGERLYSVLLDIVAPHLDAQEIKTVYAQTDDMVGFFEEGFFDQGRYQSEIDLLCSRYANSGLMLECLMNYAFKEMQNFINSLLAEKETYQQLYCVIRDYYFSIKPELLREQEQVKDDLWECPPEEPEELVVKSVLSTPSSEKPVAKTEEAMQTVSSAAPRRAPPPPKISSAYSLSTVI